VSAILDPLVAANRIASSYRRYLLSTFSPRRPELEREFQHALRDGMRISRGPFLQASTPFEPGRSTADLVAEGLLSKGFGDFSESSFPIERPLHLHQEQAIRKAVGGRNLVVATGTGSGKTEAFLLPIVNHLLREREAGTLGQPGVRALLLYPMNALANDQVKRLRRLLADVPELTFGRYVGETPRDESQAQDGFTHRYPGEPRLRNEMLSRERMQDSPPHILLTNYAMLEYLLLRPADSSLFDGDSGRHWRFVVLDEAHVYNGAQGTEVAMLLRRVRDRVLASERGRLQCFATSATLGRGEQDYPQLLRFARELFDEPFEWLDDDVDQQDIVEATRRPLVQDEAGYELPQEVYRGLQQLFRGGGSATELARLAREVCAEAPSAEVDDDPPSFLARLLRQDAHVVALQTLLERGSAELIEAARKIFAGPSADADLVALIDLCVAARHRADDAPLIPARYHFFLRSLEGAFLCQHPAHRADRPRLKLSRHQSCRACSLEGRQAAMFELGVCRNCRAEYLAGRIEDDGGHQRFKQVPEYDTQRVFLLLGEPIDEDDEDGAAVEDVPSAGNTVAAVLCPGCEAIAEGSTLGGGCTCSDSPRPIRVTIVRPTGKGEILRRCAACAGRTAGEVVFRFITGTDAPVSVIATELYQSVPPSTDEALAERVGEGRKLLTFSDSRQDAAFFAPYLENTYNRAVQRRLIAEAISELSQRDVPRTEDVIARVRRLAEDSLVLDPDESRLTNAAEVSAWLTDELLALDRRQSLEGTGSAEVSVAVPRRFDTPRSLSDLGFSKAESVDLLQLLLETVRAGGAITVPEGVDIRDARFAPRNFEFGLRRTGPENKVISWLPGSTMNRRLEILSKVLARRGLDADPMSLLKDIWEGLTRADSVWSSVFVKVQDKMHGVVQRLDWTRFEFTPLGDDHRPGRCDTCHRLWWRSVSGICPTWRCAGSVALVADLETLQASHYASLYRELTPIAIAVQEHTAQWSAAKASEIQQDFVDGRINVLSCSTTFELGVDVGEVQAVLLRNVPPTPANYVQRAGRAGRRTDSAALVVTFAQRRSHDRAHFDSPTRLVDGYVAPPVILLENDAIGRRHAHSVAFAAYERVVVGRGDAAHTSVEEFFISPGAGEASGDQGFVDWLRTRPTSVQEALRRILPPMVAHDVGLDDWSWVEALAEPDSAEPTYGWLERAAQEVRTELALVQDVIDEAVENKRYSVANHHQRVQKALAKRSLLGFLASRNVLPKYGFPVDVVALNLAGTGDPDAAALDLARDLTMAITDYAPGAQVVAAKALWESTGLQARSGQSWPTYRWGVCADCGAFRQRLLSSDGLGDCLVCGSAQLAPGKTGRFVLPLFGFVGKRKDKVGESRPPRFSSTERYFGSYGDEQTAELVVIPELSSSVLVRAQTTRQGRINVINRGALGRGYRLCDWCGYGEPAPSRASKGPSTHPDIRRPGHECTGTLRHTHLGHHLLTDVTEVSLGLAMQSDEAWSTLYALLEGVEALDIARGDVDGTLHVVSTAGAPHLIIYDQVPGGAGHARRIAENLPAVFRQALSRVESCECGEETSCYGCLRNYRNQTHHDALSRGAARHVLRQVLAIEPKAADLTEIHDDARPLVAEAISAGFDEYVVGFEVDSPPFWQVEVAWPGRSVAVVVDQREDRDAWLAKHDWAVFYAATVTPADLAAALGSDR
jgi:ATP-dependent helicase YprA (DUF1998 family)